MRFASQLWRLKENNKKFFCTDSIVNILNMAKYDKQILVLGLKERQDHLLELFCLVSPQSAYTLHLEPFKYSKFRAPYMIIIKIVL